MPDSPCPKKKSPTTAPITDRPAEIRKPAKIAGSAAGNISFRRRVYRLAWWSVNRSCMPRSADCKPNSVFTMIGKIEMITQTNTRDFMP